MKFTNGQWRNPSQPVDLACGESLTAVDYADVTGDGAPDAIVNLEADGGGSAFTLYTAVFAAGPNGPVNVAYLEGESFAPYRGGVTTWIPVWGPNDAHCCPSQYQKIVYVYSNGALAKTGTTTVPASQLPKR